MMTKNLSSKFSAFSEMPIAAAYIEKDDDLNLVIVWQNRAAEAIWSDYDLNEDVELKLSLIESFSHQVPSSFVYQPKELFQPCQFFVSEFEDGILAQFFFDNARLSNRNFSDKSIHEVMLETSKTGGFELDLTTKIVHYTQNFYEICAIDYASMGHDFEKFTNRIHPHDQAHFTETLQSHLGVDWPFEIEFRFQTSSDYIWLGLIAKIQFDDNGQAIRLIASLHNNTDNKNIEHGLKTREQLIIQIIDSLPISIYVKDENGCYRFFNHQAEFETGFNRKKIIGKTDFEFLPPHLSKKQSQEDILVRQTGKISMREERMCLKNQTADDCKWFLRGKGPINIKVDDYKKTWLLGFLVDITNQKDAEKKLIDAKEVAEAALKAKADFLSIMSHEIRTPLNSVIGGAQLLMMNDLDEENKSQIEMIHHSGVHLLNLINDILDLSKMEAQKLELEEVAFNLQQLTEVVIKMNEATLQQKNLSLKFNFNEQVVPNRLGDAARLRQVLLNLISNAIKFTQVGGLTINVLPGAQEEVVRIEVVDTGIGISQDNIEKLFTEYSQAESSIHRQFGGTGLGLAICRKIVDVMQGVIGVESSEGKGSNFWFEIPLKINLDAQNSGEKLQKSQVLDDDGLKLSILVAEDNLTNQLLIKSILKKLGHEVEIANNGLEALECLQTPNHYNLVLMDLNMPEMDGIEATREIRAFKTPLANIPIIALTANAFDSAKKEVVDAGMNDYLTKPINIPALTKILARWGRRDERTEV